MHHALVLDQTKMSQADPSSTDDGKMSPLQTMTVADISGMSDPQLIEFMKKHRSSDNSISLPIDDIDVLSKEESHRLVQRLQFVAFSDLFSFPFFFFFFFSFSFLCWKSNPLIAT